MTFEAFIPDAVDREQVALSDGATQVSYGELLASSESLKQSELRGLVLLATENTIERISAYISLVHAGIPVMLLDSAIEYSYLQDVTERFLPSLVVGFDYQLPHFHAEKHAVLGNVLVSDVQVAQVNKDLCVMLATSGSTGNPKFVKLSRENIVSNAVAIAESLSINEAEKAITSLPFSYTYGLSVINSHIVSSASLLVTSAPVVSTDFWNLVYEGSATSIAGVPTSYRMLRQMRWDPEKYPSLRYMTQAGGRLPDDDRTYFLDLLENQGIRFFVMYGQTEATARMSVAPPELLRAQISTAGYAIPGGSLQVINPDESGIGEIQYSGPNVMMGYAEHEDDLTKPQELPQSLVTGDLGYLLDGALFLVGRTKRIVKIFGVRVSLDDVDRWLSNHGHGIAVQGNDVVVVFIEAPFEDTKTLRSDLAEYLKVNKTGIKVEVIAKIPLLSSGKVDFQALTALANS